MHTSDVIGEKCGDVAYTEQQGRMRTVFSTCRVGSHTVNTIEGENLVMGSYKSLPHFFFISHGPLKEFSFHSSSKYSLKFSYTSFMPLPLSFLPSQLSIQ